MDSLAARNRMVDGQVRPSDVTDFRILEAMLEIPRERFVPADQVDLAYADFEVPVGSASSNSPRRLLGPRTLAKLIQAAMIRPGDTALVVACATGYGAAVVARLANHVVALDDDAALVAFAGQALGAVGIRNATTANGPLTAGWPPRGPYDVIVMEGATEVAPRSLWGQLNDGGRLVCIEGRGPAGRAMLYRSEEGAVSGISVFDAAAAVLPGFVKPPAFVF